MISPRLRKAGLVQVDSATAAVQTVIALQYNPDSLTRRLEVQPAGDEGDRSQALRLRGAAVETITLEAELDATDRLADPDSDPDVLEVGIHPQLAALEAMVHPSARALEDNDRLAGRGVLEILPLEEPLTLFVWSAHRVVPVRVSDLSITEDAFDATLNPIRATVSLTLRVLSVDDLGFGHRGGTLFMAHLRGREALARRTGATALTALGLEGLP